MPDLQPAVTDLTEFRERRAGGVPAGLPAGTVTYLLSDIEGSTRTWESGAEAMARAVARHYEILDAAVTGNGGVRPVEQGEGDSMVAVFARASDAVAASLAAQRALAEEAWPTGAGLRVRMALHTGEAQLRDERYYVGPSIIRCARLRALAHGGQVLISTTTADLLVDGLPEEAALLPLGLHRLKDLRNPERVFQLAHPALRAQFPPLRSIDALPNNLPAQLTSFVGRKSELAQLVSLLGQGRMVTLVGAGGCGKTRLAAHVAGEIAEDYPDGVWWVELAPLADPALVPRAVMSALGLLDTRTLEPQARIAGYLADKKALLVMDNCEHVVGAAAGMLEGILQACPEVVGLATSREPLGLRGETVWRVPALSLPSEDESRSAEQILASEAVRLFVERAAEARPSFRMEGDGAPTVAAICTRLDGIPLAIELAAARVRGLSPERILDGLSDRFRILTGGSRTALLRQQTLAASVEWSHDLLSDAERVLFRRLAAFSGIFTLEAAEDVAAGAPLESWEILTLLSDLVDKSLVIYDGDRYRLLQTIHDFARARLAAAGETDTVEQRHVGWFLRQAEETGAELETAARLELLLALEHDHDNFRAALTRALAAHDDESAHRLVVALGPFWLMRGHYFESLAWHRQVLSETSAELSASRGRVLSGLGHLGLFGMDLPGGYGALEVEQAVTLAHQLDDSRLLSRARADQLLMMSFIAPEAASAAMEECLDLARRSGSDWELMTALNLVAFVWGFQLDRADLAEPYLDELGRAATGSGSSYWAVWHGLTAGIVAWRQGRLDDARRILDVANESAWELGDPMLECWTNSFRADVHIAQGNHASAAELVRRSLARQVRSAFARAEFVQAKLARGALALADVEEARRQLAEIEPVLRASGFPFVVATVALLTGRVALEAADLAVVRSMVEEAGAIAGNLASPWILAEADDLRGRLARAEDKPGEAEDHHLRVLANCVEHGFRGVAAETLECLGSLAATGESWAEAARLFGAAQSLRATTGQARWPLVQAAYEANCTAVRAQLGDDAYEEAWEQGSALSLEETAAYASRARGERKRPSIGWAALTPTELEVVALAARGLSNGQIGGKLFITAGTAKVHLSNIYRKVGVANRAQLAAEATARGIGARP